MIDNSIKELYRKPIENLMLSTRTYNALHKRVHSISSLIWNGEDGLRKIEGIGDASIKEIKEALEAIGIELPAEGTKRVLFYEKVSSDDIDIKVQVWKYVPGPEIYHVYFCRYAGRKLWLIENMRCTRNGDPIRTPPEFDSLDDAIICANRMLEEKDKYIDKD